MLHIVHIIVNLHQTVVRYCQRTSRSVFYTSIKHHLDYRVLDNLSIDIEIRHMLILTQSTKNSISSRTNSTLQWEELLRDTSLMHLLYKELGSKESYLLCNWVAILKGTCLVWNITFNYAYHLVFRNAYVWLTNTVAYVFNRNSLAIRRVQWFIYIVNEFGVSVVERVKLQDNFLGKTSCSWRNTTSSSKIHMIVVTNLLNVANLKNCPIYISVETITQLLSHMTQVQVVIWNLAHINVLTEIRIGCIRCTIFNSLSISQVTISALSS